MSSPTPDPTSAPAPTERAEPADAPTVTPSTAPEAEAPEEKDVTLLVDPARVRRAPRYKAFFTVGAVVGIVAGLWFGIWLTGQVDPSRGDFPLLKPGVFVSVIVLGTTTLTVLLAGLAAIFADRRSLRRR